MSLPADSDEITVEWLTTALRKAGAVHQAEVAAVESAPVGQVGFAGQIYRLLISYDQSEPGAPGSLVAKFSATHSEARAVGHSMGFFEREIGFIASSPLIAPSVRLGAISPRSTWTAERRCYCSRTSPGCTT